MPAINTQSTHGRTKEFVGAVAQPTTARGTPGLLVWLLLSLAVLTLSLAAYGQTLGAYFYNDDFILLSAFQEKILGHPEQLLKAFVSPWINHRDVFLFYRPITEITLGLDFLLWRDNAFGYHLTNLLMHAAAGILLMFVAYEALPFYRQKDRLLASFFSAAIFVSFPTYVETLGCVLTRSDMLATSLMLISMLLFLKRKTGATLLFFVLAIFSKESAAILPFVISLVCLFEETNEANSKTLFAERMRRLVSRVWPFYVVLASYFIVRYCAIGTLLGGFTGSFDFIIRECARDGWLTRQPLAPIVFPFNRVMFPSAGVEVALLQALYIAAAGLAVLTFNTKKNGALLFFFGWAVSYLLCIAGIWAPSETLLGTRMAYTLMCPMSVLLVLLVIPVRSDISPLPINKRWAGLLGFLTLAGFVVLFTQTAIINLKPWLAAGVEERAFKQQCEAELNKLPAGRKMAMVNLPATPNACTAILCADMWQSMMRPPFCKTDWFGRVVIPYQHPSVPRFINPSVLRRLFADPESYQIYRWDSRENALNTVISPLPERPYRKSLAIRHLGQFGYSPETKPIADARVFFNNMRGSHVSSYLMEDAEPDCTVASDYLELKIKSTLASAHEPKYWAEVSMNTTTRCEFGLSDRIPVELTCDGRERTYLVPVAEHRIWNSGGPVAALRLDLPNSGVDHTVVSAALISGERQIPTLTLITPAVELSDCSLEIPASRKEIVFACDASKLEDARSVVLQVSKPYFYYEHRVPFRTDDLCEEFTLTTKSYPAVSGRISVALGDLPQAAKYEVRLAALNSQGKVVGSFCDPVSVTLKR